VFLWAGLPYLALGIFAVGHIWRWSYDQFGWTSRSTPLQERRLLKWGSPLFHYGAFAAIGGHVIGVLIHNPGPARSASRRTSTAGSPRAPALSPPSWSSAASWSWPAAGCSSPGSGPPPAQSTTSRLSCCYSSSSPASPPPSGVNLLGHGYNYRTTVAPWFRGLFAGSPDVTAIAHAPLIYQLHVPAAWLIWAVWPFSRLVHAWSYPLW
jgi:nitrate reductase gamma subunit